MDASTWAIERQTFSLDEEDKLIAALRARGVQVFDFIGHAFETRDDIQRAAVPRGSCYFVLQASRWASWKTAHWGDPGWYDCSNYYARLGRHLLNSDYQMMSINEFCWTATDIAASWSCDALFVRPDDGFKSFEGGVVRLGDLDEWRRGVALQQVRFGSRVLVARPVQLRNEWRIQMVDGRVAGASQYKPKWETGAPLEVVQYAEAVQREVRWPARAFAVDIALTERGLSVVEIGCLLCTGFYESDPAGIVDALLPIVDPATRS